MTIAFNHTIVAARDKVESATFLTELFGLPDPTPFGHFMAVALEHGASLDYADAPPGDAIRPQHYAFLVSEGEFDLILGRLRDDGRPWWADPFKRRPQEINHEDGGRGLYWEGPDGHWLEIITRPYGSGA